MSDKSSFIDSPFVFINPHLLLNFATEIPLLLNPFISSNLKSDNTLLSKSIKPYLPSREAIIPLSILSKELISS